MFTYNLQLPMILERYFRGESTAYELSCQLLDLFSPYFDESLQEEEGLTGEFLAAAYEIQDGVMAEDAFRQAVGEFLKEVAALTPSE